MANLRAFSVFILSRRNHYSQTRREKCHFRCSLDQITLFLNKLTFFIYSINQNTFCKQGLCANGAQWGYCWRGVWVIEKLLYSYCPHRRLKALIVIPISCLGQWETACNIIWHCNMIPLTKGQQCGKCFHATMSSCVLNTIMPAAEKDTVNPCIKDAVNMEGKSMHTHCQAG